MAHHLVTFLMYAAAPVVVYLIFLKVFWDDDLLSRAERFFFAPLTLAVVIGVSFNVLMASVFDFNRHTPLSYQTLVDAGIDSKSRKLMIFTCPHVDDQYRVLWQKNGSDLWHTYPSSQAVRHSDRWLRNEGAELWRPKETWEDNAPATLDNPSKRTISDAQLAEYCANASEEFPEISKRRARVDAFVGDAITFRWVNHNLLVLLVYVTLPFGAGLGAFCLYLALGKKIDDELDKITAWFLAVVAGAAGTAIAFFVRAATGFDFTDAPPSIDLLTPLSSVWSWLMGWVPQAVLTGVVCWLVMAWRGGKKPESVAGGLTSITHTNCPSPPSMSITEMVEALRKCKEKEEIPRPYIPPMPIPPPPPNKYGIYGDWFGSPKTDPPPAPPAPPAPPTGAVVVEKYNPTSLTQDVRGVMKDILSEDSSQLASELGVEPSNPTGVDQPL